VAPKQRRDVELEQRHAVSADDTLVAIDEHVVGLH
jgi:hypothetical protein